MSRRRVLLLAAALAGPLAGLGYLATREWQRAPAAPAAPAEKLSIALPSVPHAALLHIAAAKGYFAAEGLDMTIAPASHGKAAMEDMIQGRTDLAAAAEVVAALSMVKGEPVAIIANMLSASQDPSVVARRDRAVGAPRDLAGKKVGVTFGTSGEYFLWAFLIRHKVAPEAVTLVDLPPAQIAGALASGAIDAAATWHPIVAQARAALGDGAISFAGEGAYTQTFVIVARSDFLPRRAGAIESLLRALLKAEQLNRSRPEEALSLVADGLKVDADALRPVWKDFSFRVELQQSQLMTLEDVARWAMARGLAPTGRVRNFLPHLYLDALLAVRPERVTVVR